MNRDRAFKIVFRTATALLVVGVTMVLVALLAGCQPASEPPRKSCPKSGCLVPTTAPRSEGNEVPQCGPDVVAPCVYVENAADGLTHLYYVEASQTAPEGFRIRDMGVWE